MKKPLKVLMIEDSEDDALLLAREMKKGGLDVEFSRVATEKTLLAALADKSWDIVICDYSMPGFSGMTALRLVREQMPDIPLIIVSGTVGEEVAVEAMRAGADDYLMKGSLKRLVPAVERELREAVVRRQRREAEEALREAKEHVQYILNNTQDVIFQIDLAGNYVYGNAAAEHLTGYPLSQLLQMNMMQLVAPEHRTLIGQRLQRRREGAELDKSFEFEILHQDGRRIWVELVTERVSDENGQLVAIQGVARDITGRKRAEAERDRLAAAIEQAAETIVITDTQGAIQYVNPAFERSTGYTRQEIVGQNPRILKSGKHSAAFYQEIWDTLKNGGVWSGTFTNKKKDGTLFEEEATISPVRNSAGEVTNYVAVKRDTSERRKLEAQLLRAQRMESLGTLASGIAHDLNNVLQPVLMITHLLQDELADQESRRLMSMVEASAQRGADIIKQLLVFGRGVESDRAPLRLASLIREMVKITGEVFPKDVTVLADVPKDLWLISGNPTHLHQVLMNLSVNARDAMPLGGTLSFRAANTALDETYAGLSPGAKPGTYVLLEVSDTGTGIQPEILDRIFDPFFTTKETGKGSGLGLSTVLGIVRGHGGFLEVNSQVGQGTKFKIYLPALTSKEAAKATLPVDEPARGRGELVLVVDDEPAVRKVLQETLKLHGYQVLTANEGAEALAVYSEQREHIEVVVTDLAMPGMNGLELTRVLKRLDPQVKIVVSTGLVEEAKEAALKELGVKIFLKKPYMAEPILEALRKVLQEPQ